MPEAVNRSFQLSVGLICLLGIGLIATVIAIAEIGATGINSMFEGHIRKMVNVSTAFAALTMIALLGSLGAHILHLVRPTINPAITKYVGFAFIAASTVFIVISCSTMASVIRPGPFFWLVSSAWMCVVACFLGSFFAFAR